MNYLGHEGSFDLRLGFDIRPPPGTQSVGKEAARAKARAKAKVNEARSEASMIRMMPARRPRQMTASTMTRAGVSGMKITSTADGPLMMNMMKVMMTSM